MGACVYDAQWWTYIIVGVATLLGGVAILLPLHVGWRRVRVTQRARHVTAQKLLSRLRTAASDVLAGNTTSSKILMVLFWVVDIIAVIVYLTQATLVDVHTDHSCDTVHSDPLHHVWVAAMSLALIRFIIKFVASGEKLFMWFEMFSLVDHFTIGPTFVGIYYDKNWLGLRFLRVVYLLKSADVLQMIYILRSRNSIRIVKALTAVISVWTFGAAMFHMLENTGDVVLGYADNRVHLSYWNCVYLVLITLTTIGYGDLSPHTLIGRAFTVCFVLLALATFGTLIPELGQVLSSRNRYRKPYKCTYGKRHIMICGGITFETLTTVVRNFIHEDSSLDKTDIVIIDINKPSAELQAFFRRHFNDVTFLQGTVLDINTLKLAKMQQADAVLILANRRAADQDAEDAANIMRATAVKNLSADVRIILQLLQHHNKEQLLHIPGWNWQHANSELVGGASDDVVGGDQVICISELKMGFMAQNCLAPGVVTLLSNLIQMRSYKCRQGKSWLNDYCYGAGHEIYAGTFSPDFTGFTFTQAALLCLRQFEVLLVAVSCHDNTTGRSKLRINPGKDFHIEQGHIGFFIAQGPELVNSLSTVSLSNLNKALSAKYIISPDSLCAVNLVKVDSGFSDCKPTKVSAAGSSSLDEDANNNETDVFDATNMFHWCPARSLQESTLSRDTSHDLAGHVVFVLCPSSDQQELGLVNFVKPLRTSSILTHKLATIVFYADRAAIELEWQSLTHFPHVFFFQSSRSVSADLRHLNVKRCLMCTVLGPTTDVTVVDETLVDQRTILTTKNILSLRSIEYQVANIPALGDKLQRQVSVTNVELPLLVSLEHDASVAYVDDDDDDDPSVPLFQTLPYVCGKVLLSSTLDSLVAAAYMNIDVLTLIRALLTGGEASELERVLTEGSGLVQSMVNQPAEVQSVVNQPAEVQSVVNQPAEVQSVVNQPAEVQSVVNQPADVEHSRCRSSLSLVSLQDSLLQHIDHGFIYGELVSKALCCYGLLCLGVYRLFDDQTQKRYVITHPPNNFQLLITDKVYVLKPFEYGNNASISPQDDSNDDVMLTSSPAAETKI